MQIDLFTFIAQIINFFILIFLLKRFLYSRITRAMDRRENAIASRIERAQEKERKAEEEAERYRKERKDLEEEKEEIREKARREAGEEKGKMLRVAQREVEHRKAEWFQSLERRKGRFANEVRKKAGAAAVNAARRAVSDLSDEELEKRIIAVFRKKLKSLSGTEKEELKAAMDSGESFTVITAFAHEDNLHDSISAALREEVGITRQPEYRQDETLICGIILLAGGRKVAWTFSEYLKGIRRRIDECVKEEAGGERGNAGMRGEENSDK